MVIYIWPNGDWCYEWGNSQHDLKVAKKVDLDKWYDYDLTEKEVLACLEAIGEE
ncbi:hypothetical protein D3C86_1985680 [compost metagenome]